MRKPGKSSVASESRKHVPAGPGRRCQRRVGFLVEQDLQIDSVLGQEIAARVDNAEVEKIVLERERPIRNSSDR